MKKDKEIKLYEEPVIKVVKFTIEHGFAGSPWSGGGEGTGEDDPVDPGWEEAPMSNNSSYFKAISGMQHF